MVNQSTPAHGGATDFRRPLQLQFKAYENTKILGAIHKVQVNTGIKKKEIVKHKFRIRSVQDKVEIRGFCLKNRVDVD